MKKYRATFNSGYQKIRFEFDETEYDKMIEFVYTALHHRVNGKDHYSDDDKEDMRKVEIEYISQEDEDDAESEG